MTSYRDSRTKPSAAQECFGTSYVPELCGMIYGKYGPAYSNFETHRNKWRADIPYNPEIEQELILHAKTFIRTLCDNDSKHTNPQFLQALVRLISDYLSAYTMRASPVLSRKDAKEALRVILWDDFGYIRQMLARQAVQRADRADRNSTYMSKDWAAIRAYKQARASRRRLVLGHDPKQK